MTRPRGTAGFTLLDMLVVIAIVTILVSLLIVTLGKAQMRAQRTVAVSMIAQVRQALELYADDWGTYPPDDYGTVGDFSSSVLMVQALLSSKKGGPYADFPSDQYNGASGLFDPWGVAYRYHWSTTSPQVTAVGQSVASGRNLTFNMWSCGPDQVDDAYGYNADYPEPPGDAKQGDDVVSWGK